MNRLTMNHHTQIASYIIGAVSLFLAAQFLYYTINSSFTSPSIFWRILILLTSLLVTIGIYNDWQDNIRKDIHLTNFQFVDFLKSVLIITSSAMITYFITNLFNTTTIFAASFTNIIFAFILPKHEADSYSGAIAGMIGAYLCEHWSVALVTALATSIFFLLFKPYFKGIGGRGGLIPYVATTFVVRVLFQLETEQSQPIERHLIVPAFFLMLSMTFLTFILHERKILSVVKSAMLITLLASIIIPNRFYTLTTAAFAGSILGMSTKERIENYLHLFVIAIICFVLFIPSFHILDGIGGKLGFLSLLSYYGSSGLKLGVDFIRAKHIKISDQI